MKLNALNQLLGILGMRSMLNLRSNRRTGIKRMWNPRRTQQFVGNQQRRRRRFNNSAGMEINKAIGGNKSVRYNGRNIVQIINFKGDFTFKPNQNNRYEFAFQAGEQVGPDINITRMLNDADEFLVLRKQALQYRVTNVAITVNYNRVPYAGDKWTKLIITPETDLVEQADPQFNRNSMYLDMSSNGVKNYNFKINRGNTEAENAGWIIGQSQYQGIITIHLSQEGDNITKAQLVDPGDEILGTVKIAIRVVYRHKDITDLNAKIPRTRLTNAEVLNQLKDTKLKEIKEEEEEETKMLINPEELID